jgi:hypothetical protein
MTFLNGTKLLEAQCLREMEEMSFGGYRRSGSARVFHTERVLLCTLSISSCRCLIGGEPKVGWLTFLRKSPGAELSLLPSANSPGSWTLGPRSRPQAPLHPYR